MENYSSITGLSLKKRALKRWIYEHNFTQPYVAKRLQMSADEFKSMLTDRELFSQGQIRDLIYLMGAEAAFNVLYFPSLEEKRRVYREAFGNKKQEVR